MSTKYTTKDILKALSKMERVQEAHPFGKKFDVVFCNRTVANWFRKNAPEIRTVEKKYMRKVFLFDSTTPVYKNLFNLPKLQLKSEDFYGKSVLDLQNEINFIFNNHLNLAMNELTLNRKLWLKGATS